MLIFCCLVVAGGNFPGAAWAQEAGDQGEASAPAVGSTIEPGDTMGPPALPEGVVEVSNLFPEADAAEKQAADLLKTADVALPEMTLVNKVKDQITAATDKIERSPRSAIQVQDLDIKITEANGLINDLNTQSQQIGTDLTKIQEAQKQLSTLQAKWKTTRTAYQAAGYTGAPIERIQAVLDKLEAGRVDLEKKTKPLLDAQGRITASRDLVQTYLKFLQDIRLDLTGSLWEKDRPAIFETGFFSPPASAEGRSSSEQLQEYWSDLVEYGETVVNRIMMELVALLVVWLLLRKALARIHERTENIPHLDELRALFKNSFSIALLLVCLPLPLIHPNAPLTARELYLLVLVFPVTIILIRLIANRAYNFFILGMGLCYLLGLGRNLLSTLPPLGRFTAIIQTLVALLVVLMAQSFLKADGEGKVSQARPPRRVRLGLRVMIVFLLGTLVVQLAGYNRASVFFAQGALRTIYLSLALIASYRLVRSLAIYSLYTRLVHRVRSIEHHRSALIDKLGRWLAMFAGLVWVYLLLDIWQIDAPVLKAGLVVWRAGISVGETRVTVGLCVLAVAAMYVSILVSRLVSVLLEDEVYPRSAINTGLQNAVTQVVRYTLFFIGFVVALGMLGVRLQSLAIIAGALGVGIGFGLQSIVNNFVSGLIMLVERPIKVGDVLELDGYWAVVRHIGIRATVIETWDQSEIIVPNGDLLDSRIVNWTRSGETNRITIAVGTAYGSDPNQVIEIITKVAADHPEILTTPEPTVFFMGFGDSSLDFELRCYVPQINLRFRVASELRTAIYEAFDENGITIPFPQRDVWIKSAPGTGEGNGGDPTDQALPEGQEK